MKTMKGSVKSPLTKKLFIAKLAEKRLHNAVTIFPFVIYYARNRKVKAELKILLYTNV